MKKICYIVPYFGRLPQNFELWLNSCKTNPTIDWLIYTDDKTSYEYPNNVKVTYCTFDEIKRKIQSNFDFEINISRPWKLCDFRPAYGEIFSEDIQEYEFWGHCDLDVLWGNIRRFITNEILEKYEKIGFQGHSTLYKNTKEVNKRYQIKSSKYPSYKEIFKDAKGYCFDENIICSIYDELGIPYYHETIFAHLRKFEYNFVLAHVPENEEYKNKNQIFLWDSGTLNRLYLANMPPTGCFSVPSKSTGSRRSRHFSRNSWDGSSVWSPAWATWASPLAVKRPRQSCSQKKQCSHRKRAGVHTGSCVFFSC